jgi:hypothetical protein
LRCAGGLPTSGARRWIPRPRRRIRRGLEAGPPQRRTGSPGRIARGADMSL